MSDKRFHGDRWFNKRVEGRTKEALRQREAEFAQTHADVSHEALLDYVRGAAARLGLTPNAGEIVGGKYISSRLGGWNHVVAASGLKPPRKQRPVTSRQIFKEEFQVQARLFKRERNSTKEQRRADREAKSEAARAEQEARRERDMAWGVAHQRDSGEQLLAYIRQCAADLGETPRERDVVGGIYLRERFGGWQTAVRRAGLPPRQGAKGDALRDRAEKAERREPAEAPKAQ